MPTSGTELGQVFKQGYGQGTAEIFDTSSTVGVARDIYGQENQWNKQKQAERRQDRNDADKIMNSIDPSAWWQRDKNVMMPIFNDLSDKAAKYKSKVDNPFTGYSDDPEIQKFQKDWKDFKGMVAQSHLDSVDYEKYQNKLFDKNSNSLAPDSKKALDQYYGEDITKRWGKSAPQMRVIDPHANIYSFASEMIKSGGNKEYTNDDIDKLVEFQSEATNNPQSAKQIATYAQQAYENYTPEMKKAAAEKYGTDAEGNLNFVGMSKDLLKRALQSAAKLNKVDLVKELYEVSKQAADFTDKRRGIDGTLFLDKNTGEVVNQTKGAIKRQLNLRVNTDGDFAKALKDYYEPLIDKKGLDGLKPEEAANERYSRILDLATNDGYNTKDRSSQAVMRLPNIRVNVNSNQEDGGNMNDFLERIQYGENTISNSAANELLGKNSSLGAEIRSVKVETKAQNGKDDPNGQKGLGISYVVGYDNIQQKPTYQYEFIPFTAENESRLANLWQGSPSYGRRKGDTNTGVIKIPQTIDNISSKASVKNQKLQKQSVKEGGADGL